jgi:hypothetical protein
LALFSLDLGCLTLQLGGALPYRLLEVGQTALVARSAQARSTQCHRPDQHKKMGRRSVHGILIPPPSRNGIVSGHGQFIGLARVAATLDLRSQTQLAKISTTVADLNGGARASVGASHANRYPPVRARISSTASCTMATC